MYSARRLEQNRDRFYRYIERLLDLARAGDPEAQERLGLPVELRHYSDLYVPNGKVVDDAGE